MPKLVNMFKLLPKLNSKISQSKITAKTKAKTKAKIKTALTLTLLTAGLFVMGLVVNGPTWLPGSNLLQPVQAQVITSSGLAAIPPRAGEDGSLSAKPGETIQTDIKVKNSSEQAMTINSFAQDFIVDEDGRTPIPVEQEVSNRWSLAAWMTLVPNQVTLQPGEIAQIQVVIDVPDDALPGGHYAMAVHQPAEDEDEADEEQNDQGSAAAITNRVATLFYLKVEGPINQEAYIRNFDFQKFQEFGPVPYSFAINNQSDIHIKPRSEIEVFNMFGKKLESWQIEPKNVFPFNSREFSGKWEQIWGLGRYRATLTTSYGDMGKVAIANSYFWIVPVRLILAILVALLVMVGIILAIRRHFRHRRQQEQAEIEELQAKVEQYEQKQS
jgi:hypothetical protein